MRLTIEKYHLDLEMTIWYKDPNKNKLALTPSRVQLLCNRRHFGVGATEFGGACDGE